MVRKLQDLVPLCRSSSTPLDVITYNSRVNCDALWEQLANSEAVLPWPNLVIVFDGQDQETNWDFRPEFWLTPWDWAVAASLNLNRAPAKMPPHGFRCLIVDLLPAKWGSAGRARFKAIASLLPWLRWYRPLLEARPIARSITELFHDVNNLDKLPKMVLSATVDAEMQTCAVLWTALFGVPKDRHAIGNLIGPIILAQGIQQSQGVEVPVFCDPVGRRFRSLLQSVGIRGAQAEQPLSNYPPALFFDRVRGQHRDRLRRFRRLRLQLIDDQFALGYHQILAHALFGTAHAGTLSATAAESHLDDKFHDAALRSTASPDEIIEMLRAVLQTTPGHSKPRCLADVDVLFLDLRLFSGSNPQTRARELITINSLLELCAELGTPEQNPDLRRAVLAAESRKTAIQQESPISAGQKEAAEEDLSYLTLLPLVICAVDPSLPIVLFSSTHQREIVDVFREYSNVVTSFSKPVVSGYSLNDIAARTTADLERAIRTAFVLHNVREVWQNLCELSRVVGEDGCTVEEDRLKFRSDPETDRHTGSWANGSSYRLSQADVAMLAAEFRNLLMKGRFADSLQLPDNLLENLGGKFRSPGELQCQHIVFLGHCRRSGETWIQVVERMMADKDHRHSVRKTVEQSLTDNRIKTHIRNLPQSATTLQLHSLHANAGSQGAVGLIEQGLEFSLQKALSSGVPHLRAQFQTTADYQFYAILGALRNARSHFVCQPIRDDAVLETTACWLWTFFLVGLRLKTQAKRPIETGQALGNDLIVQAAANRWLPTSQFGYGDNGADSCNQVIGRFGHLLHSGLLSVHPEMDSLATYAKEVAGGSSALPTPE
jgi:hypothetical protein